MSEEQNNEQTNENENQQQEEVKEYSVKFGEKCLTFRDTCDMDITEEFEKAVAEEVTKRMASKTPKVSPVQKDVEDLKSFQSMSYKERVKLFRENPSAYKKLVTLVNN